MGAEIIIKDILLVGFTGSTFMTIISGKDKDRNFYLSESVVLFIMLMIACKLV